MSQLGLTSEHILTQEEREEPHKLKRAVFECPGYEVGLFQVPCLGCAKGE